MQKTQPAGPRALEQAGTQLLWRQGLVLLPILRHVRFERLPVSVAPLSKLCAHLADFVLVVMAVSHHPEGFGQLLLAPIHQPKIVSDVHATPPYSRRKRAAA